MLEILWRLADRHVIVDDDEALIIGALAYSYMRQKRKRKAYKRLLPMRVSNLPTIETDVVVMLAEKYLVRADHELRGDATADDLASEAARQMAAAMATRHRIGLRRPPESDPLGHR